MSKPLESKGTHLASGRKFGEVLLEMNLLTQEEIDAAVLRGSEKRMRLGDLLLSEGKISSENLARALASQYDLEYLDLSSMIFNKEASKIIPEKIARTFRILPIESKDGFVTLCADDPIQLVKLDNIKKSIEGTIILKVGTKEQIEAALNKVYAYDNSVDRIVKHLAKKQELKKPTVTESLLNSDNPKDANPSIEALVNKFIERAIIDRASDIHIDPAEEKVRVRVRIDGLLHELHTYPVPLHVAVVSRLKVLSNLDIAEKRHPQDGHFNYTKGSHAVDIRISTLPTVHGEKLVLRLLDKKKMRGNLLQIGMSPEIEASVQALLERPHGVIFLTGPTGSGKTTSLYSMLNQINGIERNVITVEDPVEYKFDVINQIQVNEKAGLNFAGILRNILRQDPDVIMIGEVRDQETADIAIRAALTGHLVLSTLHTNDSVSTPNRLIDMGVEPFLISSALVAVIAQRLVRVLCTHCREKVAITEEELRLLGTSALSVDSVIYGPVGCQHCFHSGYQHRIALFEYMPIDEHIRSAIIRRDSPDQLTKYLNDNGFISMRQDGIYKIAAGITSVEEVLKATL